MVANMPVYGNLTELLKPEQQELGYSLTEDKDFLYLWKDGKTVATFNAHASCLDKVDKFIENRETVENINDFWKHQGRED